MMKSDPPTDFHDHVENHIALLLAAKKIQVFHHLQNNPATLTQLVTLCQAENRLLQVVLQVLESLKIVTRSESGEFHLQNNSGTLAQVDEIPIETPKTHETEGGRLYKSWVQEIQALTNPDQSDLLLKHLVEILYSDEKEKDSLKSPKLPTSYHNLIPKDPDELVKETRNIVALFPGQGIQNVGMANKILAAYPPTRDLFEVAKSITGLDLLTISQKGPQEVLDQTLVCQLLVFVTSMAYFYHEMEKNPKFRDQIAYFAGLSLGEYTALCSSGALGFEDAIRLIYLRAIAMQEASLKTPQSMVAMVGAGLSNVEALLNDLSQKGDIYLANYLSRDNFVVAGDAQICEEARQMAAKYGIVGAIKLKVSGAFHTRYMGPSQKPLIEAIERTPFCGPSAPVVCNFTGKATNEVELLKYHLIQQLTNPVQWEETIKFLELREVEFGSFKYVELGPSMTLTNLLNRRKRPIGRK